MRDGRVDAFARNTISGWAADANRPEQAVEIVVLVDGHERGRVRADHPRSDLRALGTLGNGAHGFAYVFDPPLSPLRSYKVVVGHAETGEPLRLGEFTVELEICHVGDRTRPILVTTAAQPGAIDLMRSLAADPGIVVADSHGFGVKLMTYYAHALEVLVVPGPGEAARRGGPTDGRFVLAPNPFHAPEFEHLFTPPHLFYEILQNRSQVKIADAFKAVVTDFYETLALHQGKRMAVYFAEQCDLSDVTSEFARLAFREVREIVLLQDPRDVYCACRALWFASPVKSLAALRRMRDRALALRRANRRDTMFLRCEDLRLRPDSTLREVARFLSLDSAGAADAPALRAALAATDTPETPDIGQWRTGLDRDEIAMFEREFGEYLELFGYDSLVSA